SAPSRNDFSRCGRGRSPGVHRVHLFRSHHEPTRGLRRPRGPSAIDCRHVLLRLARDWTLIRRALAYWPSARTPEDFHFRYAARNVFSSVRERRGVPPWIRSRLQAWLSLFLAWSGLLGCCVDRLALCFVVAYVSVLF